MKLRWKSIDKVRIELNKIIQDIKDKEEKIR